MDLCHFSSCDRVANVNVVFFHQVRKLGFTPLARVEFRTDFYANVRSDEFCVCVPLQSSSFLVFLTAPRNRLIGLRDSFGHVLYMSENKTDYNQL